MKPQLVRIRGQRRLFIKLDVSAHHFRTTGINVSRPGPALFTGFWYGNDPLNIDCYGKVLGTQRNWKLPPHKVVGRLRGRWLAKKKLT